MGGTLQSFEQVSAVDVSCIEMRFLILLSDHGLSAGSGLFDVDDE